MTTYELIMVILLGAVLLQTSYITYKNFGGVSRKKFTKRPVFIDTSVLMDGRIIDVVSTGFMNDTFIIPRSVVLELQLLADKSDHDKRERARRGLDVAKDLQAIEGLDVSVMNDGKALDGVDERLLELARTHNGAVMTIDFNLNKVAGTEGIPVLNLNQLAQTMRMAHLPGERMSIELVEKGQDTHQAVGYLPDGTMVVVENASSKIGQTITVECIRSLQTVAGKMMFARLVSEPKNASKQSTGRSKPKAQKAATVTKAVQKFKPKVSQKDNKKDSVAKPVASKRRSPRPRTSRQNEDSLMRSIEQLADE